MEQPERSEGTRYGLHGRDQPRESDLLLFLLDQSASMQDGIAGGEAPQKKSEVVADALNRLLSNLAIKCAKEEGVRDYFHVGVIGYGATVGSALGGTLAGRELVPLSELPAHL